MKHSVKILGFILILTLLLSSCGQVVPETLKIKGKTYQTGFYGELIPNEMMYMAYQYDHGHGEYEKLIAVEVPKELSDYFVEFISSYI